MTRRKAQTLRSQTGRAVVSRCLEPGKGCFQRSEGLGSGGYAAKGLEGSHGLLVASGSPTTQTTPAFKIDQAMAVGCSGLQRSLEEQQRSDRLWGSLAKQEQQHSDRLWGRLGRLGRLGSRDGLKTGQNTPKTTKSSAANHNHFLLLANTTPVVEKFATVRNDAEIATVNGLRSSKVASRCFRINTLSGLRESGKKSSL